MGVGADPIDLGPVLVFDKREAEDLFVETLSGFEILVGQEPDRRGGDLIEGAQSARRSATIALRSAIFTRVCSVVSRSRSVTVSSSVV